MIQLLSKWFKFQRAQTETFGKQVQQSSDVQQLTKVTRIIIL